MKNITKVTIGLISILISTSTFAQKLKGDANITAGTSFSVIVAGKYAPFNSTFDYAIIDRFSIGAAVNHNNFGKIQRTNIGARALFHFGKNTELDFYTGMRFGASIWNGSGSYIAGGELFRPDGLFTVRSGTVVPTAQGVLGVRYLFLDWVGVNSEIAIGAPYMFSIGLSANINNTAKASKIIKDAYNSELIPADKKNILKVNLTSFLAIPGVSYERYITNRFSAELGASFQFNNSVQFQSAHTMSGVISENDSVSNGIKAYGLVKFYITSKINPFPKGWYIGASYSYSNKTTIVQVLDLHPAKTSVVYDYEKQTEQHSGGFVIGYQQFLSKSFTVDVFGGLQYGTAQLKSLRYLSPLANEENFVTYYGGHQNPVKPEFNWYILKVSVGYMF